MSSFQRLDSRSGICKIDGGEGKGFGGKARVRHHRCHRKTFKEEMVNSVKCSGEVKQDKQGKYHIYLFNIAFLTQSSLVEYLVEQFQWSVGGEGSQIAE